MRRQRDAGLGDPDEATSSAEPAEDEVHAATSMLLEEARALRRQVTAS